MAIAQGRAKQFKRGKKSSKALAGEYNRATKNATPSKGGKRVKISRITHKPMNSA